MSESNTSLALTTKKAKSIQPPLKKSELIEAMARRKHEQLCEEARKNRADYEAACKELKRLANELAATKDATNVRETDWSYAWGDAVDGMIRQIVVDRGSVTITPEQFSPEMRKQAKIIERLRRANKRTPEFNEVKRSIRDALNSTITVASDRINALLSDPATCKAIDKTLAQLDEKKPDAPAIAA